MTSAVQLAKARFTAPAKVVQIPTKTDTQDNDTGDKVMLPDEIADAAESAIGHVKAANTASRKTALADLVAKFNTDHFVSVEGGRTFVYREAFDHELGRARLDRMSFDAFKALHSHETISVNDGHDDAKRVQIADAWLRHADRRTYCDGLALLPGGDVPATVYNLWQGFGCEPKCGATLEDVKPALVHLMRVVCGDDRTAFDYFIGWLAYGVQNPGRQGEVAVVLQGGAVLVREQSGAGSVIFMACTVCTFNNPAT